MMAACDWINKNKNKKHGYTPQGLVQPSDQLRNDEDRLLFVSCF